MDLEQLIAAAQDRLDEGQREQITQRFVRFLIGEGVIPKARGIRSKPEYGADHLEGIVRYLALRARGLSVAAIRSLVDEGDAVVHLELAPGFILTIDKAAASASDADAVLAALAAAVPDVFSILSQPTQENPDASA